MLHRQTEPSLSFTFFNLDDPVVGGYTPEKIALRRAMILGFDRQAENDVVRHGQAELASQLVPPGIPGHDPKLVAKNVYIPLRPGRCSTSSATRIATPTVTEDARRQAAHDRQGFHARRGR